jgi:hypothetical protein
MRSIDEKRTPSKTPKLSKTFCLNPVRRAKRTPAGSLELSGTFCWTSADSTSLTWWSSKESADGQNVGI